LKDLTNLKTYIIDSDDPHEVDDAISLEIREGNKKNFWIHISNPCKLFLHDSNVDLNARKRNSSLYLIDQYVPMLPKDILEKANLAQNKVSETISAAIEFNDDGSINKYEITEAIIKPKYQLTYEDANEILEIEPKEEIELIEIKKLLEKSIIFRKKQGAIIFESLNNKIKLYEDKIILTKLKKTISQIIFAKSMILMGYVTSLFLDRYSPLGMNFTFSIIISIIICGIFGGLLEIFLFKPLRKSEVGNIAVLVVTIGLSIFFRHIYLLFATGKVQNFPLELERRQTYLFFDMTPRNFQVLIAGLAVMIFIGLFLSYTKIGKAMRAVRDSNELANISGINSDNIILFTWVSSSMLAGLAGIFQAIINDVRYNMGFLILLLIFAGTVLGGIGTSFGAMVGGLLIGIFVQVSVALPFMEGHTEAKNAVALAIMILILLFRPQGIFGQKERIS